MIRCLIFVLLVIAATAAEQKKTQKASRVQNQVKPISNRTNNIFSGAYRQRYLPRSQPDQWVSSLPLKSENNDLVSVCGAVGQCRPRNRAFLRWLSHLRVECICCLPACPFNTVFRQGCPCEPTCAIRNPVIIFSSWVDWIMNFLLVRSFLIDPIQPCNRQCARPRCQCRAGMVRNASGQCVLPRFCPVTPISESSPHIRFITTHTHDRRLPSDYSLQIEIHSSETMCE